MFSAPKREEIDHLTIKFVVGLIAVSLAPLTDFFAKSSITSISASYYEGGWSQTIFIGFLFAIAAFLLAYNGFSRTDMLMSKFAAAAALGVAMGPVRVRHPCPSHPVRALHLCRNDVSYTCVLLLLVLSAGPEQRT